jgi:glycerol-3-phosphate dehydrogenase
MPPSEHFPLHPVADKYDVVVVGAGVNGAGIAQAAVAAGHSVLLLDKTGIAAGTSSRSSKLIHGGLRYLESLHFGLVREALRERALMLKLAPDLVRLQDFYIPVYKDARRPPLLVRTGLTLYSILAGMRPEARYASIPRSRWDQLDGLNTEGLQAVFRYMDAQTDDALLTEAIIQSATGLGCQVLIPGTLQSATLVSDGCEVNFLAGDTQHSCHARVLVNAAGPWVNQVLGRIRCELQPQAIHLVQGTHILLPGSVSKGIYYVEAQRDGRAIFVMPWKGGTLVGTTETPFRGDPDKVRPLASEKRYLLRVLQRAFPRYPTGVAHIIDAFAGLRVLPASRGHAFHRSREVWFSCDRERAPRLLNVYGGKLTSWRATGEKVMRRLSPALPGAKPKGDTRRLVLPRP